MFASPILFNFELVSSLKSQAVMESTVRFKVGCLSRQTKDLGEGRGRRYCRYRLDYQAGRVGESTV